MTTSTNDGPTNSAGLAQSASLPATVLVSHGQAPTRGIGRKTLLAINLVLAAGWMWSTISPAVSAQPRNAAPAAARARGEYTMVAGKLNQGGPAGVYVIDSANQEIVALQWDQTKNALVGVGYRDLKSDAKALPSR